MDKRKPRTTVDFSKHELHIHTLPDAVIHDLKLPEHGMHHRVRFTNTKDWGMTVNGDFGNWMFCRTFYPCNNQILSDSYAIEKLEMHSTQNAMIYDPDTAIKELKWHRKNTDDEEKKKFFKHLKKYTDDEMEYLFEAHRSYDRPSSVDHEDIPDGKIIKPWLNCVFDAWEEIAFRMPDKPYRTLDQLNLPIYMDRLKLIPIECMFIETMEMLYGPDVGSSIVIKDFAMSPFLDYFNLNAAKDSERYRFVLCYKPPEIKFKLVKGNTIVDQVDSMQSFLTDRLRFYGFKI